MSDVDQGWESDTGPERDDESDDESSYFDWRADDDWDEPAYTKEEPDCYACHDSGWVFDFDRETGRSCRSCQPGRVRLLWSLLTFRISWWWSFHRPFRKRAMRTFDEEGPF